MPCNEQWTRTPSGCLSPAVSIRPLSPGCAGLHCHGGLALPLSSAPQGAAGPLTAGGGDLGSRWHLWSPFPQPLGWPRQSHLGFPRCAPFPSVLTRSSEQPPLPPQWAERELTFLAGPDGERPGGRGPQEAEGQSLFSLWPAAERLSEGLGEGASHSRRGREPVTTPQGPGQQVPE